MNSLIEQQAEAGYEDVDELHDSFWEDGVLILHSPNDVYCVVTDVSDSIGSREDPTIMLSIDSNGAALLRYSDGPVTVHRLLAKGIGVAYASDAAVLSNAILGHTYDH